MQSGIIVFAGIIVVVIIGIIGLFIYLQKKSKNSDVARIQRLRKGTDTKKFSSDIMYQKLYVFFLRFPLTRFYLLKIRRRLEINNADDEFSVRLQASKIIAKAFLIIIPLTILVIILTHENFLLMAIILIFELFIIDAFTENAVTKLDNDLLTQQVNFFAEMRHSYHQCNMVGEAIYLTAQETDHVEVARQAEKIYEILNSADPETELEKYYDVAPNNYLREFAGLSYLTQEFGDRRMDNNASLYLTNLNNISQEMQLEILKRDKLNYVFQSLSFISIAPILMLEPLKAWATSNFGFTKPFYGGSGGLLIQILVMVLTYVCYIFVRKVRDSGSTKLVQNTQNPWQEKAYNFPLVKKIVDLVMPARGTKDYIKLERKMKDAGYKIKTRWFFVNKVTICTGAFIVTLLVCFGMHIMQTNFVYTDPTADYNLISNMNANQEKKAMATTQRQNKILDHFRGKDNLKDTEIYEYMKKQEDYMNMQDDDIYREIKQIRSKLTTLNGEYLKAYEVLLAFAIAALGYVFPNIMLMFQTKMRQMQMEDEVMSYQTIIMMLMRIERVDVEMILEWLERYSDIFKPQISKCLNNYESGAWEALDEMKDEITYEPLIRIVESLQTAVEQVPIREAFEELDADKDYYKDKRKETNERLIAKKGRIGKVIGFAPMVVAFVGYLIIPLVMIGMESMNSTFDEMSSMNT